jgi:hypothetical protein
MRRGVQGGAAALLVISFAVLGTGERAQAQGGFGFQQRANAASLMILLGVSQGIETLPPTSGQAFLYQYDPNLDTYVASTRLGPTAFRSARTIGQGRFGLRAAGSYFEVNKDLDPIAYGGSATPDGPIQSFTRFGLSVESRVGIMSFSGTYGLLDILDIDLNVPVTVVSAEANESFVSCGPNFSDPTCATAPINDAPILAASSLEGLDAALADGRLAIRSGTARQLGASFNDSDSVGLGRISLGSKVVLYESEGADLAFGLRVHFPSPSEDDFAGPDSWAIDPRFIGEVRITENTRMLLDLGYSNDFTFDELSSFQWALGGSYAMDAASFDAGFAGSAFRQGIEWTPSVFCQPDPGEVDCLPGRSTFYTALEDNELETFYANFIGGIKVKTADNQVLSGAVNVPLNSDDGFRPDAIGTVAYEIYF